MPPILKAALWMSGSITAFSLMAVAGREALAQLDTFEIMMYRSLIGVVVICAVLGCTGNWRRISTQHLGIHLVRNLAHFTGQNLWFFAIALIPLAQVIALEFTSPLWVIVLSPLILGERLTLVRAVAAIIGFIGILIVARPDMAGLSPGVITAASAAIFFALTIMFTKRLTRTQTVTDIMFYLTAMQLVMGVAMAGYDGDIAMPNAQILPYVVLIGLAGLVAHFCMTNALSLAPATVVVPIDFIRLPTSAVLGMLLYQEMIDIWVVLGALVIFGGNYLNIWFETRQKA